MRSLRQGGCIMRKRERDPAYSMMRLPPVRGPPCPLSPWGGQAAHCIAIGELARLCSCCLCVRMWRTQQPRPPKISPDGPRMIWSTRKPLSRDGPGRTSMAARVLSPGNARCKCEMRATVLGTQRNDGLSNQFDKLSKRQRCLWPWWPWRSEYRTTTKEVFQLLTRYKQLLQVMKSSTLYDLASLYSTTDKRRRSSL